MTDYLTTIRGNLSPATMAEIFVFTLAVQSSGSQTDVATAVRDTFQTAFNGAGGLKSLVSNKTEFTEATAAEIINLRGTKPALMAATHVAFSPTLTGSGVKATPPQTAVTVSLVGGVKPNGTPFRGRFYLPGPDQSTIDPASGLNVIPDNWRIAMKNWMDLLIAGAHFPSIWSRKAGALYPVSQIRVGNRFDTVRRRRNSNAETYFSSAP